MKKNKTFKENYEELEKIVEQLSEENKDIDESIAKFKEGMELYKKCQEELNAAKEEVVKILKENGEEIDYENAEEK